MIWKHLEKNKKTKNKKQKNEGATTEVERDIGN